VEIYGPVVAQSLKKDLKQLSLHDPSRIHSLGYRHAFADKFYESIVDGPDFIKNEFFKGGTLNKDWFDKWIRSIFNHTLSTNEDYRLHSEWFSRLTIRIFIDTGFNVKLTMIVLKKLHIQHNWKELKDFVIQSNTEEPSLKITAAKPSAIVEPSLDLSAKLPAKPPAKRKKMTPIPSAPSPVSLKARPPSDVIFECDPLTENALTDKHGNKYLRGILHEGKLTIYSCTPELLHCRENIHSIDDFDIAVEELKLKQSCTESGAITFLDSLSPRIDWSGVEPPRKRLRHS
jgi:hypothetical protein